MDDLCTLSDIKFYANKEDDDTYDSRMAQMITEVTSDLSTNIASLVQSDPNARKCCIYAVLVWLEEDKILPSSRSMNQIKEGDISITYQPTRTGFSELVDMSNYEKYLYYLDKLTPLPVTMIMADYVEASIYNPAIYGLMRLPYGYVGD